MPRRGNMIQVCMNDEAKTPVFSGTSHLNSRAAARFAARRLGRNWREKGYCIACRNEAGEVVGIG